MSPEFSILSSSIISARFLTLGLCTFREAAAFVQKLPYRRNSRKDAVLCVLDEGCGTCSTKHALLKRLADENDQIDIALMMGIFKMNAANTPCISAILNEYKLDYVPEAHNYIRYKDTRLDYTRPRARSADFENELLDEIEIKADQITEFKVRYHKQFIKQWIDSQNPFRFTTAELWKIREACILELSK